jgi:TPR repeat protein
MMVCRYRANGLLIGVAVGTLFLVPTHGSAQNSQTDPCADVNLRSLLEDVIRCAGQGHAEAQFSLGLKCGTGGGGVTENDAEAVRWYRLAAEQGYAPAQSNLGLMYANGDGVSEDDVEAVRWYRLAAEQGNAPAQYNLGWMYDNGDGVPEDDTEAVRWYRLAAEQGYAGAQLNLGTMYANADGVPQDDVFAFMWFDLSATQGNETAQGNRDIILQWMTREQIAEAQRLSREWIETRPQERDD